MAEANKSGILAKAQKRLSRTKTKVLQTLGKADKSHDETFDELVQKTEKQHDVAHHLQKEIKTYLQCMRALSHASKSLAVALGHTYEEEWTDADGFRKSLETQDLLWNDYLDSFNTSVVDSINTYIASFPALKAKIAKRGRKMVDFDNSRHNLEVLQAAKKKDDAKIAKAQEDLSESKRIFEDLHNELCTELPEFYNSRVTFYAGLFQGLFGCENTLHTEIAKVAQSLTQTSQTLSKDYVQFVYTPKRPLSKSLSDNSEEQQVNGEPMARPGTDSPASSSSPAATPTTPARPPHPDSQDSDNDHLYCNQDEATADDKVNGDADTSKQKAEEADQLPVAHKPSPTPGDGAGLPHDSGLLPPDRHAGAPAVEPTSDKLQQDATEAFSEATATGVPGQDVPDVSSLDATAVSLDQFSLVACVDSFASMSSAPPLSDADVACPPSSPSPPSSPARRRGRQPSIVSQLLFPDLPPEAFQHPVPGEGPGREGRRPTLLDLAQEWTAHINTKLAQASRHGADSSDSGLERASDPDSHSSQGSHSADRASSRQDVGGERLSGTGLKDGIDVDQQAERASRQAPGDAHKASLTQGGDQSSQQQEAASHSAHGSDSQLEGVSLAETEADLESQRLSPSVSEAYIDHSYQQEIDQALREHLAGQADVQVELVAAESSHLPGDLGPEKDRGETLDGGLNVRTELSTLPVEGPDRGHGPTQAAVESSPASQGLSPLKARGQREGPGTHVDQAEGEDIVALLEHNVMARQAGKRSEGKHPSQASSESGSWKTKLATPSAQSGNDTGKHGASMETKLATPSAHSGNDTGKLGASVETNSLAEADSGTVENETLVSSWSEVSRCGPSPVGEVYEDIAMYSQEDLASDSSSLHTSLAITLSAHNVFAPLSASDTAPPEATSGCQMLEVCEEQSASFSYQEEVAVSALYLAIGSDVSVPPEGSGRQGEEETSASQDLQDPTVSTEESLPVACQTDESLYEDVKILKARMAATDSATNTTQGDTVESRATDSATNTTQGDTVENRATDSATNTTQGDTVENTAGGEEGGEKQRRLIVPPLWSDPSDSSGDSDWEPVPCPAFLQSAAPPLRSPGEGEKARRGLGQKGLDKFKWMLQRAGRCRKARAMVVGPPEEGKGQGGEEGKGQSGEEGKKRKRPATEKWPAPHGKSPKNRPSMAARLLPALGSIGEERRPGSALVPAEESAVTTADSSPAGKSEAQTEDSNSPAEKSEAQTADSTSPADRSEGSSGACTQETGVAPEAGGGRSAGEDSSEGREAGDTGLKETSHAMDTSSNSKASSMALDEGSPAELDTGCRTAADTTAPLSDRYLISPFNVDRVMFEDQPLPSPQGKAPPQSSSVPASDLAESYHAAFSDLTESSQIPLVDQSESSQMPSSTFTESCQMSFTDLAESSEAPSSGMTESSQIAFNGQREGSQTDFSCTSSDYTESTHSPMAIQTESTQTISDQTETAVETESTMRLSSDFPESVQTVFSDVWEPIQQASTGVWEPGQQAYTGVWECSQAPPGGEAERRAAAVTTGKQTLNPLAPPFQMPTAPKPQVSVETTPLYVPGAESPLPPRERRREKRQPLWGLQLALKTALGRMRHAPNFTQTSGTAPDPAPHPAPVFLRTPYSRLGTRHDQRRAGAAVPLAAADSPDYQSGESVALGSVLMSTLLSKDGETAAATDAGGEAGRPVLSGQGDMVTPPPGEGEGHSPKASSTTQPPPPPQASLCHTDQARQAWRSAWKSCSIAADSASVDTELADLGLSTGDMPAVKLGATGEIDSDSPDSPQQAGGGSLKEDQTHSLGPGCQQQADVDMEAREQLVTSGVSGGRREGELDAARLRAPVRGQPCEAPVYENHAPCQSNSWHNRQGWDGACGEGDGDYITMEIPNPTGKTGAYVTMAPGVKAQETELRSREGLKGDALKMNQNCDEALREDAPIADQEADEDYKKDALKINRDFDSILKRNEDCDEALKDNTLKTEEEVDGAVRDNTFKTNQENNLETNLDSDSTLRTKQECDEDTLKTNLGSDEALRAISLKTYQISDGFETLQEGSLKPCDESSGYKTLREDTPQTYHESDLTLKGDTMKAYHISDGFETFNEGSLHRKHETEKALKGNKADHKSTGHTSRDAHKTCDAKQSSLFEPKSIVTEAEGCSPKVMEVEGHSSMIMETEDCSSKVTEVEGFQESKTPAEVCRSSVPAVPSVNTAATSCSLSLLTAGSDSASTTGTDSVNTTGSDSVNTTGSDSVNTTGSDSVNTVGTGQNPSCGPSSSPVSSALTSDFTDISSFITMSQTPFLVNNSSSATSVETLDFSDVMLTTSLTACLVNSSSVPGSQSPNLSELDSQVTTTEPSDSQVTTTEPSDSLITPTEPSDSLVTPTEPSDSLVTPTEPSDSLVTTTEPSDSLVTPTEPSDSLVTPTEPSDSLVTPTEPSDSLVTPTEPSDSLFTATEPSDSLITPTEPSDSLVTSTEPSDSLVTPTEPSDSLAARTEPSDSLFTATEPSATEPSDSLVTLTEPCDSLVTQTEPSDSLVTRTEPSDSLVTSTEPSAREPSDSLVTATELSDLASVSDSNTLSPTPSLVNTSGPGTSDQTASPSPASATQSGDLVSTPLPVQDPPQGTDSAAEAPHRVGRLREWRAVTASYDSTISSQWEVCQGDGTRSTSISCHDNSTTVATSQVMVMCDSGFSTEGFTHSATSFPEADAAERTLTNGVTLGHTSHSAANRGQISQSEINQTVVVQEETSQSFTHGERSETVVQEETSQSFMHGEVSQTVVQEETSQSFTHGETSQTVVQEETSQSFTHGERSQTVVVQEETSQSFTHWERSETVVAPGEVSPSGSGGGISPCPGEEEARGSGAGRDMSDKAKEGDLSPGVEEGEGARGGHSGDRAPASLLTKEKGEGAGDHLQLGDGHLHKELVAMDEGADPVEVRHGEAGDTENAPTTQPPQGSVNRGTESHPVGQAVESKPEEVTHTELSQLSTSVIEAENTLIEVTEIPSSDIEALKSAGESVAETAFCEVEWESSVRDAPQDWLCEVRRRFGDSRQPPGPVFEVKGGPEGREDISVVRHISPGCGRRARCEDSTLPHAGGRVGGASRIPLWSTGRKVSSQSEVRPVARSRGQGLGFDPVAEEWSDQEGSIGFEVTWTEECDSKPAVGVPWPFHISGDQGPQLSVEGHRSESGGQRSQRMGEAEGPSENLHPAHEGKRTQSVCEGHRSQSEGQRSQPLCKGQESRESSRTEVATATVKASKEEDMTTGNVYEEPQGNGEGEDSEEEEGAGLYQTPPSNKPVHEAPPNTLYMVEATHTYSGEDIDELSFEPGDAIYVVPFDNEEEQDVGWQMGIKQKDGMKGVFPENFTQRMAT